MLKKLSYLAIACLFSTTAFAADEVRRLTNLKDNCRIVTLDVYDNGLTVDLKSVQSYLTPNQTKDNKHVVVVTKSSRAYLVQINDTRDIAAIVTRIATCSPDAVSSPDMN